MTSGRTITTTDHDEIRKWVEARGGYPAVVADVDSEDDASLLRIDYPGYSGKEKLQRLTWDEFFERLDRHHLAFFYTINSDSEEQEELIFDGEA